jgi:hypothetical protein
VVVSIACASRHLSTRLVCPLAGKRRYLQMP